VLKKQCRNKPKAASSKAKFSFPQANKGVFGVAAGKANKTLHVVVLS